MAYGIEDALALVKEGEVHRDVYIDERVFAHEMAELFQNTWIYVGHVSQIPNKGDYYCTEIGDQPVIMVRHADDTIRVLHNRCAHKGVKVVTDRGNTGKFFRCPYHAWTYKTDGSLLGVPVKRGYGKVDFDGSCASKGLPPIGDVHVYRGFVFGRVKPDGVNFDDYFGGALSSLDNMVDRSPVGELEIAGEPFRYLHHCNWKMLIENQTDSFHPMVAHESSAGTVKALWEKEGDDDGPLPMAVEVILPFMSSHDFFEKMGLRIWPNGHGHSGVNFSIHSEYSEADGYFTQMREAYGEERAKDILSENRHNTVYFPNMVVKGPVQTLRVFKPLAVDRTLVESWIFRLVDAPDMLLERTAMYNRLINAPTSIVGHDDLEMFERAQMGLSSDGNDWVNIQRDLSGPEGTGDEEVYPGASEALMRNHFRAWKKFMAPGGVTAAAKVSNGCAS